MCGSLRQLGTDYLSDLKPNQIKISMDFMDLIILKYFQKVFLNISVPNVVVCKACKKVMPFCIQTIHRLFPSDWYIIVILGSFVRFIYFWVLPLSQENWVCVKGTLVLSSFLNS